jgi:transcriptional regulator with XRE-family HTH domain
VTDGPVGVAARLKAAREQSGLSQGQVAKLMGVHRPTISEIEAGRRRVQLDELSMFAKIYRVSVSWLTGEAGDDDAHDARIQLAARELGKLKHEDLDRVLKLLKSLRSDDEKGRKR